MIVRILTGVRAIVVGAAVALAVPGGATWAQEDRDRGPAGLRGGDLRGAGSSNLQSVQNRSWDRARRPGVDYRYKPRGRSADDQTEWMQPPNPRDDLGTGTGPEWVNPPEPRVDPGIAPSVHRPREWLI